MHAQTGEPIRRANISVRILPTGPQMVMTSMQNTKTVTTGNDGSFVLEDLEPGNYQLMGDKAGFVRTNYGATSTTAAPTILRLGAGEELKDITIRMNPTAILTGRVVDEDGEPMERIQVMAMTQSFMSGKKSWMPAANMQTNENGEFRLTGLNAGKYLIMAQALRIGPMGDTGTVQQGKEEYAYINTFHPGVESADQAQQINVGIGQEFHVGQIRLIKTRVYRVSGRFTGAVPDNPNEGMLMLNAREKEPANAMMAMNFVFGRNRVNPDGTFEVTGLKPGQHEIVVMRNSTGTGMRTVGIAEVVVGSENIKDLVIPELQPVSVTGRVRLEGDAAQVARIPLKNASIMLMPPPGVPMFSNSQNRASLNEDGSFRIDEVIPGTYRLNLNLMGAPTYVKALRLNGRDVMDAEADFRAGGEVEVVFSTKVASVGGQVEKADENAAAGIVVFERVNAGITSLGNPNPPQGSVNQEGKFQLPILAPGEYRAYAFEALLPGQGSDKDLLKKFISRATAVKVGEGESANITLRQISAAEVAEAERQ